MGEKNFPKKKKKILQKNPKKFKIKKLKIAKIATIANLETRIFFPMSKFKQISEIFLFVPRQRILCFDSL